MSWRSLGLGVLACAGIVLAEWAGVEPRVTDGTIYRVRFTDALVGAALAEGGCILTTRDGGISWSMYQDSGHRYFRDISFADSMNGFAVGDSGLVLQTSDGGVHWRKHLKRTEYNLWKVQMVGPQHIWAFAFDEAGGLVLRSSDGGTTWSNIVPTRTGRSYDMLAVDARNAYVTNVQNAEAKLLRTADGGETWQSVSTLPPDPDSAFVMYGMSHVGTEHLWVSRRCRGHRNEILRTSDGGATWSTAIVDTSKVASMYIGEMSFSDAGHGWVFTSDSSMRVYHTADSGRTWLPDSSALSIYESMACLATDLSGKVWLAGEYGGMYVNHRYSAVQPAHRRIAHEMRRGCSVLACGQASSYTLSGRRYDLPSATMAYGDAAGYRIFRTGTQTAGTAMTSGRVFHVVR